MNDNELWHLTRRLKGLQHEMLQPEMGQHMEYAGNVTHRVMNKINAITTCIYGWWRLYGYIVLRKTNFSLQQRNIFYLTIMVVETLRMVPPSQSQLKVIINPTKLI